MNGDRTESGGVGSFGGFRWSTPLMLIMHPPILPALLVALLALCPASGVEPVEGAVEAPASPTGEPPWAEWVEADFPFFSSVLDARNAGDGLPADNLSPRTIVLNLGHDCWLGFDVDLLRVAAVWHGKGVTPLGLAPGSYHRLGWKTRHGQSALPEPDGRIWLANGIYPGWQAGDRFSREDPREPAPSPEEVGRGGLPENIGRFERVRRTSEGAVLEYRAGNAEVREWTRVAAHDDELRIERHFTVGGDSQDLLLVVGEKAAGIALSLGTDDRETGLELMQAGDVWVVRVPARPQPVAFCVAITEVAEIPSVAPQAIPQDAPGRQWPHQVTTSLRLSAETAAYVVDHVDLPLDNPWRRAVRPADVQFLSDGTGYLVTLDGDVWRLDGLDGGGRTVRWSRFASGLHEPLSLAIRDDEVFVFDRNGIWQLRDTNGDGEADVHELFSNVFAQTADGREFASTIRLAPGGKFVIAKGGQQGATLGKHNGSVVRISADGRRVTVLGHGFRQPSIGVNVRTGLVTSSDQQGQYVPTTPLHIVRDEQFYGYLAAFQPPESYPAPIADPLTWIPHAVNASAMSQVWLFGARLGPLNDELLHIGFTRPELFRVMLNDRGTKPQAAVVSITQGFEYPLLNGSVNPADGMLYIAGFRITAWSNVVESIAGLGRVRYTGAPVLLPREVVPMDKGVLLRFEEMLDRAKATDPANYSLESWHYVRTQRYGSPQFKVDGTPGHDALQVSSAYLSLDGRSVFVGVPDMKPVMQLRVGWSLATADGLSFQDNAYTTVYELAMFDPRVVGFGDIEVDLTVRDVAATAIGPVSVDEGRRIAQMFACVGCHAIDDAGLARAGPSWKGLQGSERLVVVNGKRTVVTADAAYLRESIIDPTAKLAAGFDTGEYAMPSYTGVLDDAQIESLILYIETLR